MRREDVRAMCERGSTSKGFCEVCNANLPNDTDVSQTDSIASYNDQWFRPALHKKSRHQNHFDGDMATDRPNVLRQAIIACRKGGTVSIPGVYGGFLDKILFGAVVNKALTIKSGQTHVHRYLKPLLKLIQDDKIDPSFVITHRLTLDDAPQGYETFKHRVDNCIKIVLKPNGASA